MQIQPISFQGNKPKHGVRKVGQLMNKLYSKAYEGMEVPPDIIQVSAKMNDGTYVTGIASFDKGYYTALTFPYEHAHYRSEFCQAIIRKYNEIVTKGKAYK